MKLLYKMSMVYFFRYLISSILFFVLILELLDVFQNLWRYINNGVPLRQILHVAVLYFPKCVVFSLPISVLFSIAYTLGNFYANNELIAIFGCGVSLYKFVLPFILMGIILSTSSFFFEEKVVIRTYREKGELTYDLLNRQRDYNNTNVTIIDHNHNRIYHADYYNDTEKVLSNVVITENDGSGWPVRLDANVGEWDADEGCWVFHNVIRFKWDPEKNLYAMTQNRMLSDKSYDQSPDSFRNVSRNIEEMEMGTAKAWIETLQKAGLPYKEALTEAVLFHIHPPYCCPYIHIIYRQVQEKCASYEPSFQYDHSCRLLYPSDGADALCKDGLYPACHGSLGSSSIIHYFKSNNA